MCLVLVGALVGAVFDGGRAFPMVGSCVVWAWSGGWTTDVMLCKRLDLAYYGEARD